MRRSITMSRNSRPIQRYTLAALLMVAGAFALLSTVHNPVIADSVHRPVQQSNCTSPTPVFVPPGITPPPTNTPVPCTNYTSTPSFSSQPATPTPGGFIDAPPFLTPNPTVAANAALLPVNIIIVPDGDVNTLIAAIGYGINAAPAKYTIYLQGGTYVLTQSLVIHAKSTANGSVGAIITIHGNDSIITITTAGQSMLAIGSLEVVDLDHLTFQGGQRHCLWRRY